MENIYTFNIDDTLSQEFIDKLNNNYSIKKITITLKNVINELFTDDDYFYFRNKDKNRDKNTYDIYIITISQNYYNNTITFNCNPFIYSEYHNSVMTINYDSKLNHYNSITSKNIDILKYEIELIENTREYNIYYNGSRNKNINTYTMETDCFNNYDELKNYFIKMSGTSNEIFDKWIEYIMNKFRTTNLAIYEEEYIDYNIIYEKSI